MLINNYADDANHENECESGEDMKAAFEKFNNLDKKTRMECENVSMDVKALYPSMRWDLIVTAVRMMIENSELEIQNVDYHEVGKYLSIMMTEEEIITEGLVHVVPKRKNENTRSITINYLQDERTIKSGTLPGSLAGSRKRKC